MKQVKLLY